MKKRLSLWIDHEPKPDFPPLENNTTADVAVLGAGTVGLTSALLLAQAGKKVVLLEADKVCGGTTAYSTAKVTTLHSLIYARLAEKFDHNVARTYAEANQAGLNRVRKLIEQHDIACDMQTLPAATYTCDPERLPAIRAEVETARELGLPASFVEELDLPYEILGAVQFADQLQIDTYRYGLGLAQAFTDAGGVIHEHTRAVDVKVDDGTCTVHTRNGSTVSAGHVILATQLPFLDRGGFFARAYPSRSYLVAARLKNADEMPGGMYISADSPIRTMRPARDGSYLVAGGQDHKTGHIENTESCYDAIEDWLESNFAGATVDYRWSAQDWIAMDDIPYVGRLDPVTKRLFTATGMNKWGLSNGTAAAMMLRDLILEQPNPWHSVFDSLRVNFTQSAGSFTKANLQVAKHMVKDKAQALKVPDASELAPGSGGVVSLNGNTVAAYRHEDGTLEAVSPVCTHMGCNVVWNSGETTWDCPCHGSRFGTDGRVIIGPAVEDLKPPK